MKSFSVLYEHNVASTIIDAAEVAVADRISGREGGVSQANGGYGHWPEGETWRCLVSFACGKEFLQLA